MIAATAALIGSARSIFLGFGGGRGVVTLAGTMLVILPVTVFAAVGPRRDPRGQPLHVARVAAELGRGPAGHARDRGADAGWAPIPVLAYAFVGPAIVWIAHADNIDRLVHGTERRFDFAMLRGKGAGEG